VQEVLEGHTLRFNVAGSGTGDCEHTVTVRIHTAVAGINELKTDLFVLIRGDGGALGGGKGVFDSIFVFCTGYAKKTASQGAGA
jgi:hypothetical protein